MRRINRIQHRHHAARHNAIAFDSRLVEWSCGCDLIGLGWDWSFVLVITAPIWYGEINPTVYLFTISKETTENFKAPRECTFLLVVQLS